MTPSEINIIYREPHGLSVWTEIKAAEYKHFSSLYFFVLGNNEPLLILAIVLALSSSFCTDQTLVISCLSSEGHLHHMQENLVLAASITVVMAKYF